MSLIILLWTWFNIIIKPLKAVWNRDFTASKPLSYSKNPFTIVKSLNFDLKWLSAFIYCLHAMSSPRLPRGVLNAQIPSTSSYSGNSEPPTRMNKTTTTAASPACLLFEGLKKGLWSERQLVSRCCLCLLASPIYFGFLLSARTLELTHRAYENGSPEHVRVSHIKLMPGGRVCIPSSITAPAGLGCDVPLLVFTCRKLLISIRREEQ